MSVRVIYSPKSLLVGDKMRPVEMAETSFISVDEAKAAPIPPGMTFAGIETEDSLHVWSEALGWQELPREPAPPDA